MIFVRWTDGWSGRGVGYGRRAGNLLGQFNGRDDDDERGGEDDGEECEVSVWRHLIAGVFVVCFSFASAHVVKT